MWGSREDQLLVKHTLANTSRPWLWLHTPAWLAAAQGFHPQVPSWKGGSCVCWAMTELKPPKTHGGEATHLWVTRALRQLLQRPPGPSWRLHLAFVLLSCPAAKGYSRANRHAWRSLVLCWGKGWFQSPDYGAIHPDVCLAPVGLDAPQNVKAGGKSTGSLWEHIPASHQSCFMCSPPICMLTFQVVLLVLPCEISALCLIAKVNHYIQEMNYPIAARKFDI